MNLFDAERKRNKNIARKVSDNEKLWNANVALSESMIRENELIEEVAVNKIKNESNSIGRQMTQTRSSMRRKLIAEKMRFENECKNELFKEAVFHIFMEALLLDDDFKEMYSENLKELCYNTLDEMMKERNITLTSLGETASVYIQDLVTLCEETAKEEADDKYDIKKLNANIPANASILNEKPCKKAKGEQLVEELNEDDIDQVDDIVKDKVIRMVRAQQDAEERENMMKQEIEDETIPLEELDARSDEEMANRTAMKQLDEIEDAEPDNGEERDLIDDMEDMEEAEVNEAAMLSMNRIRRPNKLQEEDIFTSLKINLANKALSENTLNEANINMDLIFAEALAYYTLLETLHTSRIVEFTPREARSLAKELIFRGQNMNK